MRELWLRRWGISLPICTFYRFFFFFTLNTLGYRQIRNFMVQKMKIIPPLAHFFRSLSICFVGVGRGSPISGGGGGFVQRKKSPDFRSPGVCSQWAGSLVLAIVGESWWWFLQHARRMGMLLADYYVCMYVQAHNNSNNRDYPENMLLAGSSRRPNH